MTPETIYARIRESGYEGPCGDKLLANVLDFADALGRFDLIRDYATESEKLMSGVLYRIGDDVSYFHETDSYANEGDGYTVDHYEVNLPYGREGRHYRFETCRHGQNLTVSAGFDNIERRDIWHRGFRYKTGYIAHCDLTSRVVHITKGFAKGGGVVTTYKPVTPATFLKNLRSIEREALTAAAEFVPPIMGQE